MRQKTLRHYRLLKSGFLNGSPDQSATPSSLSEPIWRRQQGRSPSMPCRSNENKNGKILKVISLASRSYRCGKYCVSCLSWVGNQKMEITKCHAM